MASFPVRYSDQVSSDFALATLVWILFVGLPLLAHIDYPDLFGDLAEIKLFALATLGMTASFSLFAGSGRRIIATVPGLIAGAGGFALYFYFPFLQSQLKTIFPLSAAFWIFAVGNLPGVLLFMLLRRWQRSTSKD